MECCSAWMIIRFRLSLWQIKLAKEWTRMRQSRPIDPIRLSIRIWNVIDDEQMAVMMMKVVVKTNEKAALAPEVCKMHPTLVMRCKCTRRKRKKQMKWRQLHVRQSNWLEHKVKHQFTPISVSNFMNEWQSLGECKHEPQSILIMNFRVSGAHDIRSLVRAVLKWC